VFFSIGLIARPTFAQKIAGNHFIWRVGEKYIFKT
jgi:hypothetical protein